MQERTFTATGLCKARTFRTVKELSGAVPFVWIPHQRDASAIVYLDQTDTIRTALAVTERSDHLNFSTWTEQELIDCFGEDAPAKALDTARKFGKVYEINGEWLDSGDEFQWALDVLGDDMHASYSFENDLDGAINWIETYCGHQSAVATLALAEALERAGYIEEVKDKEDDE